MRLAREIVGAGAGLVRLIRFDPRWPEGFDASAGGFFRSFLGQILALPFFVLVAAAAATEGWTKPAPEQLLWIAGTSRAVEAVAYPLAAALLARPLKLGEGYVGFVVVTNWSALFLSGAAAAAGLLCLAGQPGFYAFTVAWLLLSALTLFATWRAAFEMFGREVPVALMMVVLSVGVGVAADQLTSLAFGGVAFPAPPSSG